MSTFGSSKRHADYEIKQLEEMIKLTKKAKKSTAYEEALLKSWKRWRVKLYGKD